jgi:hypothetical protein
LINIYIYIYIYIYKERNDKGEQQTNNSQSHLLQTTSFENIQFSFSSLNNNRKLLEIIQV